jgi:hypothetical protein
LAILNPVSIMILAMFAQIGTIARHRCAVIMLMGLKKQQGKLKKLRRWLIMTKENEFYAKNHMCQNCYHWGRLVTQIGWIKPAEKKYPFGSCDNSACDHYKHLTEEGHPACSGYVPA